MTDHKHITPGHYKRRRRQPSELAAFCFCLSVVIFISLLLSEIRP